MQAILIVVLSVFACIIYGVIHDQITARICVEYFTVGHAPVFQTEEPTMLGLGWGVRATWWFGLILGIPLATAARIGGPPKRSAVSLIRPVSVLMGCTAVVAAIGGCLAFVAAGSGWISVSPEFAAELAPERHTVFLVDLWIHNSSYAGGFIGGTLLLGWVWWTRIRQEGKPGFRHTAMGSVLGAEVD